VSAALIENTSDIWLCCGSITARMHPCGPSQVALFNSSNCLMKCGGELGARDHQRNFRRDQPRDCGAFGVERRIATEIDLRRVRKIGGGEIIGPGDHDRPCKASAAHLVEFGMRDVAGDVERARGMAHQVDARWVAATCGDLSDHPCHRGAHVLRARRPGGLRDQTVGHVDADKAVFHGPQHDVVIERAARNAPVAADEGTAMNEDQHRSRRRGGLRREDVEQVAIGRAIFDVALDLDALIRFFLLQRRVECAGSPLIDRVPDFDELRGDVGGHWALVGPRRRSHQDDYRGSQGHISRYQFGASIFWFLPSMAYRAADLYRFRRDDSCRLR
jgi:hypothetical protein